VEDLIAFVQARLEEDEAVARGTTVPPDWHQGPGDDDPEWAGDEMVLMWPPEFHTPYEQDKHWRGLTADPAGLAAHIARHDPARVVREVEAGRQAIAHHRRVVDHCRDDEAYALAVGAVEVQLKIRATVYADHPDYREAWRP
jgi:hypothetical protein